jgi:catechol 2,3-dioxygenase-like lactoylglutathione lyase family enzyme
MSSNGISGHNHTSFTVSNRERSVAFYTNVLGFAIDRVYELQGKAIEQIVALSNAQLKMAHLTLGGGDRSSLSTSNPRGSNPRFLPVM